MTDWRLIIALLGVVAGSIELGVLKWGVNGHIRMAQRRQDQLFDRWLSTRRGSQTYILILATSCFVVALAFFGAWFVR